MSYKMTHNKKKSSGKETNLQVVARWGHNVEELDELDDWSSEWELVKSSGG